MPNEESDVVREYEAMHEEDFWSSWPREDERGKEEGKAKTERKEERVKREEQKEENEAVTVKRRCEGFVCVEAFEILCQGGDLESCGDLSW